MLHLQQNARIKLQMWKNKDLYYYLFTAVTRISIIRNFSFIRKQNWKTVAAPFYPQAIKHAYINLFLVDHLEKKETAPFKGKERERFTEPS